MGRRRLLFLAHRIPYPPDKGDKIRAWHMLDHLADRWDVDLGCLVDDPADLAHLGVLRGRCAVVEHALLPNRGRIARALMGMRPGRPLSLGWFRDARLAAWARAGLGAGRYDAVLAYSSAMAPYALGPAPGPVRRVLDMVDVDSEKWRAYAAGARPPMRQVWAREARTLLAFERRAAAAFDRTLLVSREEAARFANLAPEVAGRIGWVDNGVDLGRFDPTLPFPASGEATLVFTGRMDYRPNVEAVIWFAGAVMPLLRARWPAAAFSIVGAKPSPDVLALAQLPGVTVTGEVPDTRPFIAAATACVAPLRIARGIQNKVLEAMAMARPVICSPQAFEGVHAVAGRDLLVADDAGSWVEAIGAVFAGRHPGLGPRARQAIEAGHDWTVTLRALDAALENAPAPRQQEVAA
ncbi:TIGR03087 family PEP-CTERM/XrtA system glycosyltransferase [Roseomonas sp. CAU 1739]|uniref:TIGR03087 family PEP-CTERM/XrtA system glycosyltransferase n=1 Tax=Roseomonas sp. CAU 1739 TaxID=3140364 RepID=UPI00325BE3AF